MVTNPDRQSIFGDTYDGVANPLVPHVHPYPTRYHGGVWHYPQFGMKFRDNPYAVPSYMGVGDAPASSGLLGAAILVLGVGAVLWLTVRAEAHS